MDKGYCFGKRCTAVQPSNTASIHGVVLSPFTHSCPVAGPHHITSPAASSKYEMLIPKRWNAHAPMWQTLSPLTSLTRCTQSPHKLTWLTAVQSLTKKQSQLPGVPSALGLTPLRGIIRVGSGRITDIPFNKPSSPSTPPQFHDHSLHLLYRWEQEPWCKSVALLVHASPKSRKTPLHQTGTAPSIRSCYLCPSSTWLQPSSFSQALPGWVRKKHRLSPSASASAHTLLWSYYGQAKKSSFSNNFLGPPIQIPHTISYRWTLARFHQLEINSCIF